MSAGADWDAERADDLAADIAMEDAQDPRTGEEPPDHWLTSQGGTEGYEPKHAARVGKFAFADERPF